MNDLRARANHLREAYPAQRREPPRETGKRLATIQRGDDAELRVVWDSYEGKPYVAIRLWERRDGSWYPSKTGMTVRLRELADFADGIGAALDEMEAHRAERAGGARAPSPPQDTGGLF